MEYGVKDSKFKVLLDTTLEEVKKVIKEAEENNITNEQYYIDFEVELSQLATKDHNV